MSWTSMFKYVIVFLPCLTLITSKEDAWNDEYLTFKYSNKIHQEDKFKPSKIYYFTIDIFWTAV